MDLRARPFSSRSGDTTHTSRCLAYTQTKMKPSAAPTTPNITPQEKPLIMWQTLFSRTNCWLERLITLPWRSLCICIPSTQCTRRRDSPPPLELIKTQGICQWVVQPSLIVEWQAVWRPRLLGVIKRICCCRRTIRVRHKASIIWRGTVSLRSANLRSKSSAISLTGGNQATQTTSKSTLKWRIIPVQRWTRSNMLNDPKRRLVMEQCARIRICTIGMTLCLEVAIVSCALASQLSSESLA